MPRNDPKLQAYQPSPAQVEWAVDLAVRGALTGQRPANYLGWGLPAYSPQGLLAPIPLSGGGRVPAQVMLGILAQESNLWQASWHILEGLSGNSLIGDYYGTADGISVPNFPAADCGYGIGQVTTGMRTTDTYWTADQRKAIAVDYQANIAASLRMLVSKWNETRDGGLRMNNGDPAGVVNWFFAVWAYNTGFYPRNPSDATQPWGVGWSNNPVNPKYKPNRRMFLAQTYDDAKTPNLWSYPERVMGWASQPIIKNGTPAYAPANYGTVNPEAAQPTVYHFCTPQPVNQGGNQCDRYGTYPNDLGDPAGPCMRRDLKCWWHSPAQVAPSGNCAAQTHYCGAEVLRYAVGSGEPAATSPHPPVCARPYVGPGTVTIIDNLPDSTSNDVRPQVPGAGQCRNGWSNGGTFTLQFGRNYDANDRFNGYASKVDFHQVGSGFGGHFWFAHSYCTTGPPCAGSPSVNMKVTGTWKPASVTPGWHRILVHIPSHGAHSQQATYRIHLGNGQVKERVIEQRRRQNEWVSLGVFSLTNGADPPRVELTNIDRIGNGTEDVAFDAIAFARLPAKPKHFVVALGDSYASGEGTRVYETYSDNNAGNQHRNACRRSTNAWPRLVGLPGAPANNYTLESQRNADLDFHFKPCSGARTYNIVPSTATTLTEQDQSPNGTGQQYRWVTQLESGFLDENTTLVTVAVGGNDAKWSALLGRCASPTGCIWNEGTYGPYDPMMPTEEAASRYMTEYVGPSIDTTLRQIRAKAPNATIVLMGYPALFNGEPRPNCTAGLDADEKQMADRLAALLANVMQATATGTADQKIHFVDPRQHFLGHGVCSQQEYLNGIILGPQSEGDNQGAHELSMNSFHPNSMGQQAYANALFNKLQAVGYRW
ncbi:hypothetical protein Psuf_066270 [Phytohabitans suffuscus]|uniref:Uncharacterized protein n=1 Tax=Phytohabitans suffuscus TaxID=624315 RepID=A0A6F8YT71_9ACTN|nr:SGNH/GDSL hydrolase family protein [Phytohabitans suffuscus]BCB89314.1 hypothetical protein Psuf_066270 [Phytohabitans suffuscus]